MKQINVKAGLNEAATKSLAKPRPLSIDDDTYARYQEAVAWLNEHKELWFTGKPSEFKELNLSSTIVSLIKQLLLLRQELEAGVSKKKK